MAGSTAAQFAVSREAILRRPLEYWHRVMALNNGSINLCGVATSERWGGDVTGAMERVWHNLFRTGTNVAESKASNNGISIVSSRNDSLHLPNFKAFWEGFTVFQGILSVSGTVEGDFGSPILASPLSAA